MLCKHLRELEVAILEQGIKETYRGQAWTERCREWAYFDCRFRSEKVRERFDLAECVRFHEHFGTHDGQEAGFVCLECDDAVMGIHPRSGRAAPTFP